MSKKYARTNFLLPLVKGTRQSIKSFSDKYWQELCDGKISKKECVERAFAFLLEREPKESILREFDMTTISRYFPEFGRKYIYSP